VLDEVLILRKLSDLKDLGGQLSEYRGISIQDYAADWKAQRIIERTLQMMIEACLDISNHIISGKGYRRPQSYSDFFRVLHENQVLPSRLTDRMEKMAKFRNIIVHNYDKVDAEIVVGIMKKNLSDFEAFRKAAVDFLGRQN